MCTLFWIETLSFFCKIFTKKKEFVFCLSQSNERDGDNEELDDCNQYRDIVILGHK